ncbi:MAG: AAA family ATPase [Microvirga sp.]
MTASIAQAPTALDDAIIRSAEATLETVGRAREAIHTVIFGQEDVVDLTLITLLAGGHGLLVGVPGLAKTKLVETLGIVLGLDARRIQFTPDLMPSDILGSEILDEGADRRRSFRFVKGPVFAQLLMADEINRASPRTQSALLQAMQEHHVSVGGERHDLPQPFHVLATQNPIEQEGTYPLPEAQLDRFLLKILMDYPEHEDEVRMVGNVSSGRNASDFDLSRVLRVLDRAQITGMQLGTAQVTVDPVVLDYAVRVARATRTWPGISLGAGPRGSLALVRAARANAVLQGRDFTTPDDVRAVAKPALRHRLTLAPELQIEGQRVDQVLDGLLLKVEAPRK